MALVLYECSLENQQYTLLKSLVPYMHPRSVLCSSRVPADSSLSFLYLPVCVYLNQRGRIFYRNKMAFTNVPVMLCEFLLLLPSEWFALFFSLFSVIYVHFFFIDFLMDFANRNIRYGFLKEAIGSENVEILSYEQPIIKVISKYSIADPNVSQFLKNVSKFERSVSVPANHCF